MHKDAHPIVGHVGGGVVRGAFIDEAKTMLGKGRAEGNEDPRFREGGYVHFLYKTYKHVLVGRLSPLASVRWHSRHT